MFGQHKKPESLGLKDLQTTALNSLRPLTLKDSHVLVHALRLTTPRNPKSVFHSLIAYQVHYLVS